jgi:hypothetical protein
LGGLSSVGGVRLIVVTAAPVLPLVTIALASVLTVLPVAGAIVAAVVSPLHSIRLGESHR